MASRAVKFKFACAKRRAEECCFGSGDIAHSNEVGPDGRLLLSISRASDLSGFGLRVVATISTPHRRLR
jgi:hypothetical protein